MNSPEKEESLENEEREENCMTYAELYSSLILNGELIITLPASVEERVKTGLKNYKARQANKAKELGLPVDSSILSFTSIPSEEIEGAVKLTILLTQKSSIPILKIEIPDNTF